MIFLLQHTCFFFITANLDSVLISANMIIICNFNKT